MDFVEFSFSPVLSSFDFHIGFDDATKELNFNGIEKMHEGDYQVQIQIKDKEGEGQPVEF